MKNWINSRKRSVTGTKTISSIVICVLMFGFVATCFSADNSVENNEATGLRKTVELDAEGTAFHDSHPEEGKGPTKIEFMIFIIDIDKIDAANQAFAASFFVTLRWKDQRLAADTKANRKFSLDKIWTPQVVLANEVGTVRRSLPRVAAVQPDGTVTYRQRYIGPLSQPLQLSQFPMDEHLFAIQFMSMGRRSHELEFVPMVRAGRRGIKLTGGGMSELLSLPDWKIMNFQVRSDTYEPVEDVSIPGFILEFTARRYFSYYFWQIIVPMTLIVIMACAVFWIDPTNIGSQTGMATSSVLTLIAYRFVVAGLLPRLPYMTKLDYFILGSTLLVFLALIEVIVTSSLVRNDQKRRARKLDLMARVAFPTCFLLVLGWFVFG